LLTGLSLSLIVVAAGQVSWMFAPKESKGMGLSRDEEGALLLQLTAEWFVGKLISRGINLVPMAVTLSPQDDLKGVTVHLAEGGGDMYWQLLAALRQAVAEGRYRGVAVCSLGDITEPGAGEKTRAVIVDIEHENLAPRVWIWPFQKVGGEYRFGGATGKGYIRPGTRQVFDAPDQPTEFSYTGPFGTLVESISVAPKDLASLRAQAAGRA
jgi:hypothetical protein